MGDQAQGGSRCCCERWTPKFGRSLWSLHAYGRRVFVLAAFNWPSRFGGIESN